MLLRDFQSYFFLRSSKMRKNGDAPIYLRIEAKGKRKDISTKLTCPPRKWNSEMKMVIGRDSYARQVNQELMEWNQRLHEVVEHLFQLKKELELDEIRDQLLGQSVTETLQDYIEKRIAEMGNYVGHGYQQSTLTNYKSTLKHIVDFEKTTPISLKRVDYKFLSDFFTYLISNICGRNTANKYMRCLRAVLNEAVRGGLLKSNPFQSFKLKYEKRERGHLNAEELQAIIDKDFGIERLEQIRDLFLFACYTGLAYADVKSLTKEHLLEQNGRTWIMKTRSKSHIESVIPLLEPPRLILEKYQNHPVRKKGGLLPTPTNQKVNAYLKEIADLCGISKNLTFHLARHTFATTVMLSNHVPMETVSKMLGHTKLTTTQEYAKVNVEKIFGDVEKLFSGRAKS